MLTRPLRLIAVFACAAMLGLHPAAAQHKLENLPALIPTLLPQVVNISFLRHQTPGDKLKAMEEQVKSLAPTGAGVGTGFIVDALGIICTNRHVTDGGDEIYVTLSDNVRLRAELIYRSPDIDLALLRVKPPRLLTPVKFGDSDDMIQGTEVIAIGNPLGLGGTVTTGIVSARDRDIQETALDSFMQIDASINPGNSGGPLFNAAGELIGMNTALFTVSTSGAPAGSIGLNFAIPGNDVKLVLDQLRETGRVRHGQLGATVQDISPDLAEAVGLSTVTGAIVTYLSPNSPATAADLRDGDVILKLNDVVVSSSRAARRFILSHPGAKGIRIQVLRDGTETTLSADLLEVSAGPERVDMAMLPVAKMRGAACQIQHSAGDRWGRHHPGGVQGPRRLSRASCRQRGHEGAKHSDPRRQGFHSGRGTGLAREPQPYSGAGLRRNRLPLDRPAGQQVGRGAQRNRLVQLHRTTKKPFRPQGRKGFFISLDANYACGVVLASSVLASSMASTNRLFSSARASPLACWIRSASSLVFATARS
jgi:S1-C subfamily serine protease